MAVANPDRTAFHRRLQHFDLKPVELLTQDPDVKRVDKPLIVEGYVCGALPTGRVWIPSFGAWERPTKAREILSDRIAGVLGARIVKMKMTDFIQYDAQNPDRVANTMTDLGAACSTTSRN